MTKWTVDKIGLMDVLREAKDRINSEEYAEIRNKYKSEKPINLTPAGHRILVGRAVTLAKQVFSNGGSEDEIDKVLMYLYITMDALKYNLDWKRYKEKNDIYPLMRKYIVKEKEYELKRKE